MAPISLSVVTQLFITPTPTHTHEATPTTELGIILQDGGSSSGIVSFQDAKPLEGEVMVDEQIPMTATGYTCANGNCIYGMVLAGD